MPLVKGVRHTVAVGLVGSVSVFPLGQKIACSFNSDFSAKIPIIGVSVAEISECAHPYPAVSAYDIYSSANQRPPFVLDLRCLRLLAK